MTPDTRHLERREEETFRALRAALLVIQDLTERELRGKPVQRLYPPAQANLALRREQWMRAALEHRAAVAREWLQETPSPAP